MPLRRIQILLKGESTVITDEGKILHLKAGDSNVEVVNKWHHGQNDGNVSAEIIVVYAGTVGTTITVKKETSINK